MYLIISNEKTCNYFCKELTSLDINVMAMPCVELIANEKNIDQFKYQINNFDIIIITSPAAINCVDKIFRYADKKIVFIVSGISSSTQLRRYTENKIYAPTNGSGAEAVINQVLKPMDLLHKKIAILQGKKANCQIQEYLTARLGINAYERIIIYQQQYLDLDIQILKKLCSNNLVHGIILTSSSHAEYLFNQAYKFGCYEMLRTVDFITLHIKIEQVLRRFRVERNIIVSDVANHKSLIGLIRKLHGRHGRKCES